MGRSRSVRERRRELDVCVCCVIDLICFFVYCYM